MSKRLRVVALATAILLIAGSSIAQDATTHDIECFVSMGTSQASPDEKTRFGALAVASFYLGRLDQIGLTLEQIQSGVEKIALSPTYQQTQKKEFSDQCLRDVNERMSGLKALAARDNARMLEDQRRRLREAHPDLAGRSERSH
jgi:hypothetical protein